MFFHIIFHSSTYSMSHNTSVELQLVLHCLRIKNCISIRAQISAVVRTCSNWKISPAQLAKQYSKNQCYHQWYNGQTFATCRYLPSRGNSALVQLPSRDNSALVQLPPRDNSALVQLPPRDNSELVQLPPRGNSALVQLPPRDNSALVQILTTVCFPLSVNVTQVKEFNLLRSHDSFTLDKQIRNVCYQSVSLRSRGKVIAIAKQTSGKHARVQVVVTHHSYSMTNTHLTSCRMRNYLLISQIH
jgi:hypothetical protein